MTPRWLSVLFLLGLGAGVLLITYRGYKVGQLPVRGYNPTRDENPFGFRFSLLLYGLAGLALCMWGLLALLGMAPNLKWR